MSADANKQLIRNYIQAVDDNDSSDWSLIDEYIAPDFVAHNPPLPGVSLDRDGVKQAAEIFRNATPGTHEIPLQVAEDDLVVSYIVGAKAEDRSPQERQEGAGGPAEGHAWSQPGAVHGRAERSARFRVRLPEGAQGAAQRRGPRSQRDRALQPGRGRQRRRA
jgi:hypothetical protein